MAKVKWVSCGDCEHCWRGDSDYCNYRREVKVAAKPRKRKVADDGWRREMAMEAGMGLGVEAYNDAMGC